MYELEALLLEHEGQPGSCSLNIYMRKSHLIFFITKETRLSKGIPEVQNKLTLFYCKTEMTSQ